MLAVSSLAHADACLSSYGHRLQGKTESRCEMLAFDGLKRTYRTYLPAHLAEPAPVVLMLHGGGGSGSAQELLSKGGFNRIADREGIVVLYPDSVGRKHAIDRHRVFVTGMSNGGFMSFRLARDAADVFRAAAPVVAGLSVDLGPKCKPARPVSISIMNGTDDPLVPWQGGAVNCDAGTEVRLYEIRGGGHNWPRGAKYLGESMVGRITQEFNGDEEIWSFFKSVSKQ